MANNGGDGYQVILQSLRRRVVDEQLWGRFSHMIDRAVDFTPRD